MVDPGIFGAEVFEKILADPSPHLITWQTGYVAQPWEEAKVSGHFKLTRVRNHASDLRSYDFQDRDQKWEKDPRLRQIVVQATDPTGRVAQGVHSHGRLVPSGPGDHQVDVWALVARERCQVPGQALWDQSDHQLSGHRIRPVTGPGEGSTDPERPTPGVGQTSAESASATVRKPFKYRFAPRP